MSADPEPSPQTIDFVYDHIKDAPERQLEDVAAIDDKSIQVFAAAAVIIGATALVEREHGGGWATAFIVAALGCFLATAYLAFRHLRPVEIHGSRYGDTLWPDFQEDAPQTIKHGIVLKITEDYAHNRDAIEAKARTLTASLWFTAVEAGLVAGAVLLSRLVN